MFGVRFRNKEEFKDWFFDQILPGVSDLEEPEDEVDLLARRDAWNNIVDGLVLEGRLPREAQDWEPPW